MASKDSKAEKALPQNVGYELFIAGLSVLSILNLIGVYVFSQEQDIQYILWVMNGFFLPIFLGDFIWRMWKAPSKSHYFFRGFGWADLISSLPFPQVKIFRVFRLWRVARVFREFGVRQLWADFLRHRADNALLTVVFLVALIVEFGAVAELYIEQYAPGANITTASDAIWYVYVTITTVGYGDHYPVTNPGRLVGVLIMTAGVGVFGTLAGFLSNKLLTPPAEKAKEQAPAEPSDPKTRVAEIRRMLAAQEQAAAELRAKLEEIDRML